jgi:hypothetical protein
MAWMALALLSLGELLSVHYLLLALWMTAYPYADLPVWRTRFYARLFGSIAIGALWGVVAFWLFRDRRGARRRTAKEG